MNSTNIIINVFNSILKVIGLAVIFAASIVIATLVIPLSPEIV